MKYGVQVKRLMVASFFGPLLSFVFWFLYGEGYSTWVTPSSSNRIESLLYIAGPNDPATTVSFIIHIIHHTISSDFAKTTCIAFCWVLSKTFSQFKFLPSPCPCSRVRAAFPSVREEHVHLSGPPLSMPNISLQFANVPMPVIVDQNFTYCQSFMTKWCT